MALPQPPTLDPPLTAPEAAAYLRESIQTLYNQRSRGVGPRAIRVAGGRLLFRRADLDAWLDAQADTPRPGAA